MPRSKRQHHQAELEEELCRCARLGNLERVRDLVLIERVLVNCVGGTNYTPLIHAIVGIHAQVARFLLENGANADVVCNCGMTALSYAIDHESVAILGLLLEYGADIEKPCFFSDRSWAYSPLGYAISERHVGMVTLLLRFGAKTEETLFHSETISALMVACEKSSTEIVQLLLDHDDGAYVNSIFTARDGIPTMVPLCWACINNNMEIAQLLVQNGARVILPGLEPCPLFWAVLKGSLELVQFLLDNSPFSTSANGGDGYTWLLLRTRMDHPLNVPLTRALLADKQLEKAQLLVDRGADVDSVLLQCAENGSVENVRFLLRNGAHVDGLASASRTGETPLWIAACHGRTEMVKELLKAGADMTIRSHDGETPLGAAYRQGHKGIVYLLLRTSPQVWPRLRDAMVES